MLSIDQATPGYYYIKGVIEEHHVNMGALACLQMPVDTLPEVSFKTLYVDCSELSTVNTLTVVWLIDLWRSLCPYGIEMQLAQFPPRLYPLFQLYGLDDVMACFGDFMCTLPRVQKPPVETE